MHNKPHSAARKRYCRAPWPGLASARLSTRKARLRAVQWALLLVWCAAVSVLGASSAYATDGGALLALAKSVNEVLDNIRNWIMGVLAGLATVFLTIGGVIYLMAGGDPGEVQRAKSAFKSAGWGYGIAALAPLVVEILKGIVGA